MQKRYEEIRRLGAGVLVVTQSGPQVLAAFLRAQPLPFPLVGDPERKTYRAFGLEETSVGAMVRPGVLFRYLGLMFRGWRPRMPHVGENVLQLGGDFVLDAESRLIYAHPSAEPTDRPSLDTLLQALRAATKAVFINKL